MSQVKLGVGQEVGLNKKKTMKDPGTPEGDAPMLLCMYVVKEAWWCRGYFQC